MNDIITLGTQTQWGAVAAVGFRDGERYYMMVDKWGYASLMPGDVVESATAKDSPAKAPSSPAIQSETQG